MSMVSENITDLSDYENYLRTVEKLPESEIKRLLALEQGKIESNKNYTPNQVYTFDEIKISPLKRLLPIVAFSIIAYFVYKKTARV